MDARLAELYGTNKPDEADLEKLAAAEFADGLAEDEEIDLDDVDEDTLEQLAQEVVDGEGQEKVAEGEEEGDEETEEGEEEEEPTEEQVKVAEADQLGRIMAHAYVQELRGIQKEADIGEEIPGKKGKKRVSRSAESTSGGAGAVASRKFKVKSRARLLAESAGKKAKAKGSELFGKAKGQAGKAGKFIAKHPKKFGGGAAAAAGLGGLAAWKKKKAASTTPALDALASQRAQEILAENGLVDTEEQEQGEETDQTKYDVLAAAVEQKAYQMLEDAGYRRVEE